MAQCKISVVIKYLLQEEASLSERLTYIGGIPTSSPGCPADGPDGLQHLLQYGRITFDERLMEPDRDLTGACLRLRLSQTYEACRLSSTLDLGLHPFLVHPVGERVPIQALLLGELGDADLLILCSLQIFSDQGELLFSRH